MPFLALVNDLHRNFHGDCAPLVLLVLSVMFDTISQRVLMACLQGLRVYFMIILLLLKWAILIINHKGVVLESIIHLMQYGVLQALGLSAVLFNLYLKTLGISLKLNVTNMLILKFILPFQTDAVDIPNRSGDCQDQDTLNHSKIKLANQ